MRSVSRPSDRARRGRRPTPASQGVHRSFSVTAVGDGIEHEMSDEAMTGGSLTGRLQAMCGELISPAALTEPPGKPCAACAVELNPLPELRSVDSRAQRRALVPWLHALTARTNRLVIQGAVVSGVAA